MLSGTSVIFVVARPESGRSLEWTLCFVALFEAGRIVSRSVELALETISILDTTLAFDEAAITDVIFLRFIVWRNSSSDDEVRLSGSSLWFEGGGESGLLRMAVAPLFLNMIWTSFVGAKFDFVSIILMLKLFVRKGRPQMMLVDGDVEDARKFAVGVAKLKANLSSGDGYSFTRQIIQYTSSSGSNLPFPALPFHFLL